MIQPWQAVEAGRKADEGGEAERDLARLFEAHHERILRVAWRLTGSPVDAEDVLQTVFLRLSRREDLDLAPNPGSYLHRAAINASLDLLRQRLRVSMISIDEMAEAIPIDPSISPEKRQFNEELREAIRQAMATLKGRSAEMFVLKYIEGFSNQEIATRLGTSAMVVGVMLHRARARVRKQLGDYLSGSRIETLSITEGEGRGSGRD
jgi:RNA polymerase sigma-70 factor (ECF subfamily)